MIKNWDDTSAKAGSMVRAALWMVQEVGEGNVFTKEEVRRAFPKVSQIDRRIRDLRDYGWRIDTNSTDPSLLPHEQRFAQQGVEVWIPEKRAKAEQAIKRQSPKNRERILAEANYQCQICGIAGGQTYPEAESEVAVLGVSNRTIVKSDGSVEDLPISECKRCRSGTGQRTYSVTDVEGLLQELSQDDLERIRRWHRRGIRGASDLDRAWNGLRFLPEDQQAVVLSRLEK